MAHSEVRGRHGKSSVRGQEWGHSARTRQSVMVRKKTKQSQRRKKVMRYVAMVARGRMWVVRVDLRCVVNTVRHVGAITE